MQHCNNCNICSHAALLPCNCVSIVILAVVQICCHKYCDPCSNATLLSCGCITIKILEVVAMQLHNCCDICFQVVFVAMHFVVMQLYSYFGNYSNATIYPYVHMYIHM